MQQGQQGRFIAGRYRLADSPLASGGFGRIWKARDENLHVDVAVKEVLLSQAGTPQEREDRLARATREARHAAQLRNHPNIVSVHDVVVDDGAPWIVMELVTGRSLEQELHLCDRLPADRAATIAHALLSALGAAHDLGIVHRDVKPANVLLADDGRTLLTDFGIAVHELDTRLTGTGMVIGSFEYIAPERADGGEGGPASDLFSLGVTLYQTVEGFSPFRRPSASAALRAVLTHEPPQPQHAGPLSGLITRLLAKDSAQRPSVPEALTLIGQPERPSAPRKEANSRRPATLVATGKPAATTRFHAEWTGREPIKRYAKVNPTRQVATATLFLCGLGLLFLAVQHFSSPICFRNESCSPREITLNRWGIGAVGVIMGLGGLAFPDLAYSQYRRQAAVTAWSLDLGPDGVTATSGRIVHTLPWSGIESLQVGAIRMEGKGSQALLAFRGLHVRPAADAQLPFDMVPIGWPTHNGGIEVRKDGWKPVCVLGPLTEGQRRQLDAVAVHFTGAPVKFRSNLDHWK